MKHFIHVEGKRVNTLLTFLKYLIYKRYASFKVQKTS